MILTLSSLFLCLLLLCCVRCSRFACPCDDGHELSLLNCALGTPRHDRPLDGHTDRQTSAGKHDDGHKTSRRTKARKTTVIQHPVSPIFATRAHLFVFPSCLATLTRHLPPLRHARTRASQCGTSKVPRYLWAAHQRSPTRRSTAGSGGGSAVPGSFWSISACLSA